MLSRRDLEKCEEALMKEITRRRGLGDYNPDAPALLMLCNLGYELVRHIRETADKPEPRAKPRRK